MQAQEKLETIKNLNESLEIITLDDLIIFEDDDDLPGDIGTLDDKDIHFLELDDSSRDGSVLPSLESLRAEVDSMDKIESVTPVTSDDNKTVLQVNNGKEYYLDIAKELDSKSTDNGIAPSFFEESSKIETEHVEEKPNERLDSDKSFSTEDYLINDEILLLSEDDLIEELELEAPLETENFPTSEENTAFKFSSKETPLSSEMSDEQSTKNIKWFTSDNSDFSDVDKEKIEEELTKNEALVIEEDFAEIRSNLENLKDDDNTVVITYKTIEDITERVIILEDEENVDNFLGELSEKKRTEMKKLLSYLDGLFEKLPEDVIRSFAESEYFDIYSKIMKDIGA